MAEENKENKVEVPLNEYSYYMELLDLPHTLMAGTLAMRAAGEKYLPKNEKETTGTYNARLARSVLLGAYKRTIEKLTGEVFSKPITIPEDMPEYIQQSFKNIDGQGTHINTFARQSFAADLRDGVVHLLVDYPKVQKRENEAGVLEYLYIPTEEEQKEGAEPMWLPFTQEVEREMQLRVVWVQVPAKDLIGWRFKIINNVKVLTQIRIREQIKEDSGRYGVREVNRIRVIEPGRYEIHEMDKDGNYQLIEEGETSIDFVPLVTIMFGEKLDDMVAMPPLDGLAWLNLLHWQSSSDQRHILHYARLITYFGKLLTTDEKTGEVVIGANRLIHGIDQHSDFKVIEHSGKGIEAGHNDLQELKKEMAMYGLIYMMPQTGNITATQYAIDASEIDSALKSAALVFQEGFNKAIEYTALILGQPTEDLPTATVNQEFKSLLQTADGKLLLEAFRIGLLPRQIVFDEFVRRGTIKTDEDFVDIMSLLEEDARQTQV